MRVHNLIGGSFAALATVSLSGVAQAQDRPTTPSEPAPEAASDAQSSQTDLSDIIVTAQRIAQPLQRVPVSVQPVTGTELENRRISDLVQLQTAVPSLSVGNDNTFTIRGVGSLSVSTVVDSSVGVAVDDVSLGVPLFMNYFGFEDIDRVEVLMGPQGLLFGRNTSAGLLNIVSRRPELGDAISGSMNAEVDYRDQTPGGGGGILRGTVNLPLSSKAALRLNGFYSKQDPIAAVVARAPRAKFGHYQTRLGIRGKFLYEPTDALSIYLVGDFARNRGIGGVLDRTARYFAPGSVTAIFAARDGIAASADNLKLGYSSSIDGGLGVDTGGGSMTLSWHVSDHFTISNILAYRYYSVDTMSDGDFTTADGLYTARDGKYRQLSNELRATIEAGDFLDGQFGIYYFDSLVRERVTIGAAAYHLFDPLYAPLVGPSDSITNPYIGADLAIRSSNSSYAGFGQFNLHPAEGLTLILGGRATRDNNHIALVQNQNFYLIPLGAPNYRARERVRNTDFSWKIGGQYDLSDLGMVYASYSKGYKGPAFNGTAATAGQKLAVGPETVHALEGGVKLTLLDRRLRLNLAAFRNMFDGMQVQGYNPATLSFYTQNAAKVKSQGVEAFVEARPASGLTLSVSATLLDSKFLRFVNDQCYPGQPTCSALGVSDSSGNRTPSSARFTSSVTASYQYPVAKDATLNMSASWYHRSPVNFSANANPEQRLGAIDTLDGAIGLSIDARFRIGLFCKNCTGKKFPTFINPEVVDTTIGGVNSTVNLWGYNSVRTIGLNAGFDF